MNDDRLGVGSPGGSIPRGLHDHDDPGSSSPLRTFPHLADHVVGKGTAAAWINMEQRVPSCQNLTCFLILIHGMPFRTYRSISSSLWDGTPLKSLAMVTRRSQ